MRYEFAIFRVLFLTNPISRCAAKWRPSGLRISIPRGRRGTVITLLIIPEQNNKKKTPVPPLYTILRPFKLHGKRSRVYDSAHGQSYKVILPTALRKFLFAQIPMNLPGFYVNTTPGRV